jgi:class 3 adenylate cyclase
MGICGFESRFDYTANGNAVNLASRRGDIGANGETLVNHRAFTEMENDLIAEQLGEHRFKGFQHATQVLRRATNSILTHWV